MQFSPTCRSALPGGVHARQWWGHISAKPYRDPHIYVSDSVVHSSEINQAPRGMRWFGRRRGGGDRSLVRGALFTTHHVYGSVRMWRCVVERAMWRAVQRAAARQATRRIHMQATRRIHMHCGTRRHCGMRSMSMHVARHALLCHSLLRFAVPRGAVRGSRWW